MQTIVRSDTKPRKRASMPEKPPQPPRVIAAPEVSLAKGDSISFALFFWDEA